MRYITVFSILSLVGAWDPSPELGFDVWPKERTHQVGDDYWIGWAVEDAVPGAPAGSRIVTLALAVNTLGYVAFGLSHNGGMRGADMVVIRGENGNFTATSMSSLDYITPQEDAVQPWKLVDWNQVNGESYFVVQRTAGGCTDNLVNIEFKNVEQRYIFAFGRSQIFVYHSVAQRHSIQLDVFVNEPIIGAPDLPYVDFIMPGYEVSLDLDSFFCAKFTFPLSDKKYHVVAIDALIDHPLAHHFVGWHCPDGIEIPDHATPEGAWECLAMPQQGNCEALPFIWTQGQQLYTLASHVGIPFGRDGAQNVILQMHNNNPLFETGIRDTSGLRFYYTDELRPNDIGVLVIGQMSSPDAIVLPANNPNIHISSDCPEKCTQTYEPVTVVSIHWHMHQVGRSMDFHLIRDGQEIVHYGMDYWDYNWQGFYENEEFDIRPGDRFYTECTYDTRNRTDTTYGGDGTQDEMCFFYISVYPLPKGEICLGMNMRYSEAEPHITLCNAQGDMTEHMFEPYIPLPEKEFCEM